jgi:serine/threonine protein kinase
MCLILLHCAVLCLLLCSCAACLAYTLSRCDFLPPSPLLLLLCCPCSEGIVHADLKAANVMLTNGGANAGGVWGAASNVLRMTAKVADFGLALPLDPSDTHATLSARVRAVWQRFLCLCWCYMMCIVSVCVR